MVIATSELYSMLKPREIRDKLRGKVDPEVGAVLVRLCEDIRETHNKVHELAKMMDQWVDVIAKMMMVTEAMKEKYEKEFGAMKMKDALMINATRTIKEVEGDGGDA